MTNVTLSTTARRHFILLLLAVGLVVLLFRALGFRAWSDHAPLRERAAQQLIRSESVPAYRGKIVDRHAEPLAISRGMALLRVMPKKLAGELIDKRGRRTAVVQALAKLARKTEDELAAELATIVANQEAAIAAGRQRGERAVTLWAGFDLDLERSLRALKLDHAWTEIAYRRQYPDGAITAHLLGLTDKDQNGLSGLELRYDRYLRGVAGHSRVIRDRTGNPVAAVSESVAPQPGPQLRLSIDRRIQYILYKNLLDAQLRHRAKAAYGVVVDSQSGEVLAMANLPGGDPNDYANRDSVMFRNRVAVDRFEPGSTLKPLTAAIALDRGLVNRKEIFDTDPGFVYVDKYPVRDIRPFGKLDLAGILIKSSNVGIIQVANRLQASDLWGVFDRLGFGRVTELNMVGEVGGVLTPLERWTEADHVAQSYGYGVAVTALQLAKVYTMLASQGVVKPLTLLHASVNRMAVSTRAQAAQAVVGARAARQILAILERVTQTGGTARRAAVTGYRVAGKTGTVRKPNPKGPNYLSGRYLALFAGIVPVSDPRLVMVVVIDEPSGKEYHGGQVAAPVFGNVMHQVLPLLGIPPDGLVPGGLQLASHTAVTSQ